MCNKHSRRVKFRVRVLSKILKYENALDNNDTGKKRAPFI